MAAKNQRFLMLLASAVIILAIFVLQGGRTPVATDELISEGYNADLSGQIYPDEKFAYFEGQNIEVPATAIANEPSSNVLGSVSDAKWIEVDLSDQKLYAWEGNSLYLDTLVSSGLPRTPTPKGEFRIWIKLRATKMEGGSGRGYYYLPNVPYVMFFEGSGIPGWKGYSLHGTYWHSDFGNQRSHGCVNLPTPIAQRLYDWVSPVLTAGKNLARASNDNLGTKIVIHD